MKKLSLKSLNLGADDLLKRQELKTVLGGYTGGCNHGISRQYVYNAGSGCWHWGTLITGSNCDSLFIPETNATITSVHYPPKCGHYA